ncbi:Hypothetical protein SMAX5B_021563 [Scophthalmus maximus]|uniref:Uncharacterized protein n=1 Tax=Scophthalmus maximus TaxID=52904 RepID=A0A2U9B6V7_SCOMX|nr:Hypothetical protein SMAX5B_021563 [Scophthalmus maximus]
MAFANTWTHFQDSSSLLATLPHRLTPLIQPDPASPRPPQRNITAGNRPSPVAPDPTPPRG